MQNNPYFPQQKKNPHHQQAQFLGNAADTGSVVSSTSSTASGSSSIVSDVLANVQNESLMDCELVSSLDQQAHLASRFVLGARSSVLRKQLFSNKNKKKTKQGSASPSPSDDSSLTMIQLQVPYSSTVIQTLLEYCHTDAIVRRSLSATAVREWLDLMDCAQTYQLPGLQVLVERLAESVFLAASSPHNQHHLPLACALLDECLQHEDDASSSSLSLQQIAWHAIRQNPAATLLHQGGVTHCSSPTTLTRILQDDQLQCSELVLFRAIQIWLQQQQSQPQKEEDASLQLLSWMDWTRMAPSELVGPVRASGLVDEPVIQQALAEIAQRVERETSNHYHYDRLFDRPRSSSAVPYCGGASVPSQPLFPQDPMDAVAKRGHSDIHKIKESSSSSNNSKSSIPASPRLLQQERPRAAIASRVGRWSPTSVLNSHLSSSAQAITKEQQQQQKQETTLDTNSLTGKQEEEALDIPSTEDTSSTQDTTKSVLRRHFDSVAEKLDFVCQHGCMATTTATASSTSASVSQ